MDYIKAVGGPHRTFFQNQAEALSKGLILLAVDGDHVGDWKNRHETHGGDLLRSVTLPSMAGGDYKQYGLGHGSRGCPCDDALFAACRICERHSSVDKYSDQSAGVATLVD